LHTADALPSRLMPGDVVFLPTNLAHKLSSTPDAPATPLETSIRTGARTPEGAIELPGDGAVTRLLCGAYDYDHEVAHPLLSLLPGALYLTAGVTSDDGAVGATLRLLQLELGGGQPGSRAAVARLIDLLFVQLVRAWMSTADDGEVSWLRALHDPVVAEALARLHQRPQREWTVDALAAETHVSRAALTRRFTKLVGDPPVRYLTRWRMDLAAKRLRTTDDPVALVANSVGYTSEYAFSRAFRRARGEPPGRYRARARAGRAG
jgi:AraC-like DNA-binding protein